MSQDQATKPVESTDNQQQQAKPRTTFIRDALAAEEIPSAFVPTNNNNHSDNREKTSDTGFFRDGLASAFALEEQPLQQYEVPVMLQQIRDFFANYDFADRSDKTKGFTIVSAVYSDMRSCEVFLESMLSKKLSISVRQQIMDDLTNLSSFQAQAFDYMEEVRPTF